MKFNVNLLTLVPLIVHGIQTAESMKGASGADKKAKAIDLVRIGLAGVEGATGKHPLDVPEALDAVSSGIDAVVAATNALAKAKAPAAP